MHFSDSDSETSEFEPEDDQDGIVSDEEPPLDFEAMDDDELIAAALKPRKKTRTMKGNKVSFDIFAHTVEV